MVPINSETRSFFNECVAEHCGGDRAVAESAPIEAVSKAVFKIKDPAEAERFFAGFMHWVRGRKPRSMDAAYYVAMSNVRYCFDEGLPPKQVGMWEQVFEAASAAARKIDDPVEEFKRAAAVGAQLKAGKDPGLMSVLAKKALKKAALPESGT